MRLYYIFSIKEDIYKIGKNDPEKIYTLLNHIHQLDKKEVKLGYRLFEKSCNFFNKKTVNSLIKNLNYDNYTYTQFRNSHIINNFYNNETSKLEVNSSHLQLKTNIVYPKFFNEIINLKNVFICDFVNEDYFFLKKINTKTSEKMYL